MAWTQIAKPTGTTYTNLNPMGKEQYDQASLTYDDANTYYDGVNMNQWTDIPKPTGGTSVTIFAGMTMGLLMPLTYSTDHQISSDQWTKVSKPT